MKKHFYLALALCILLLSNKASATLVVEKWIMEVDSIDGSYFSYSVGDTIEFQIKYIDVGRIVENYFQETSLPLCTDPVVLPNINCNRTYEGLTEFFYSEDVEFTFPELLDMTSLISEGNDVDFGAKGKQQSRVTGEGHRRLFEWGYENHIGFHFYSSLFGVNGGYKSNVDIFTWRYNSPTSSDFLVGVANFKNVNLVSREAIRVSEPSMIAILFLTITTFLYNIKTRQN